MRKTIVSLSVKIRLVATIVFVLLSLLIHAISLYRKGYILKPQLHEIFQ